MHDVEGLFCKTVIHWIKGNSQVRKKNTIGPKLAGPTGANRGRGLLTRPRGPAGGEGGLQGARWAWRRGGLAGPHEHSSGARSTQEGSFVVVSFVKQGNGQQQDEAEDAATQHGTPATAR